MNVKMPKFLVVVRVVVRVEPPRDDVCVCVVGRGDVSSCQNS